MSHDGPNSVVHVAGDGLFHRGSSVHHLDKCYACDNFPFDSLLALTSVPPSPPPRPPNCYFASFCSRKAKHDQSSLSVPSVTVAFVTTWMQYDNSDFVEVGCANSLAPARSAPVSPHSSFDPAFRTSILPLSARSTHSQLATPTDEGEQCNVERSRVLTFLQCNLQWISEKAFPDDKEDGKVQDLRPSVRNPITGRMIKEGGRAPLAHHMRVQIAVNGIHTGTKCRADDRCRL